MSNGIVDGTSGSDVIDGSVFVDSDGEYLGQSSDITSLFSGGGNDTITLNTFSMPDYLNYTLHGEDGDDVISAFGQNTLAEISGGEGNDSLHAGNGGWFDGHIQMHGGAGEDDFLISTFSPDWVTLGTSRPVFIEDFNAFDDRLFVGGEEVTPTSINDTSLRLTESSEGFTLTGYSYSDRTGIQDWGETGSVVVTGSTWFEYFHSFPDGEVDGTSGDDIINLTYTDAQGDTLSNDGNADIVFAGRGNDTVNLYGGNDTARGGFGDDRLYGMKGNNVLQGQWGNDFIHSGRHTSELFGGDGEDVLVAQLNKGADHELTGGADADTYRLEGAVEGKTSNIVIHDFLKGADVLVIDGVVVDLTDLPDGMSLDQDDDGNAVLSFADDETVTFIGVGAETLASPTLGIVNGTPEDDKIYAFDFVDGEGEFLDTSGSQQYIGVLDAGDGNDSVIVSEPFIDAYGELTVLGGGGDDFLSNMGPDQFGDGGGYATLVGGDGNDSLSLFGYYDYLDGVLIGGAGEDEFHISLDWTFGGLVTANILDFKAGEDRLTFQAELSLSHLEEDDYQSAFFDLQEVTPDLIDIYAKELDVVETDDGFRLNIYDTDYDSHLSSITGTFNVSGSTWDEFVASFSDGQVNGTDADEVINLTYADAQGDTVSNDGNADIVLAEGGDDTVALYRGNDTAYGGEGDDRLYGMKGNNVLHGDAGNDFIHSGRHTSEVFGGDGEDILVAQLNKGADHQLTGGDDADTFQLQGAVEGKTSNVVIHDFVIGEDVLEIDGVVVDVTDLPDGMSLDQDDDGNAVLSFADDETVTLIGVGAETLASPTLGVVNGTPEDDDFYAFDFVDGDGEFLGISDSQQYIGVLDAGDGSDSVIIVDSEDAPYGDITVLGGGGDDFLSYNSAGQFGGSVESMTLVGGDGNDEFGLYGHYDYFGADCIGGAGEDVFHIAIDWAFGGLVTADILDFKAGEDRLTFEEYFWQSAPSDVQEVTPDLIESYPEKFDVVETDDGFRLNIYDRFGSYAYSAFNVSGSTWDEFVASFSDGQVNGTDADEVINLTYADAQGDTVSNDGNADIVFAEGGDDTVTLYGGNDTAHGGEGDDRLYGVKGNNVLHGDAGNDFIHSGRHTSEVFGGDGEDILVAQLNKGADHQLTGGDDADTFQLQGAVEGKTSNVVIHDFVIGEDVLEIDGVVVDVTDLPDGMSLDQDDDGNAVLSFADDETVTLVKGIEGLDLGDGLILPFVPLDESMDIDKLEDDDFPKDLLV